MAHRVLVVEDDPVIQLYCREALERGGFTVDSCGTVAEARALLERKPELLVLDLNLPDGNGLELMREVQKRGHAPPILFMTAAGDLKTRLDCFQQGAQDYLLKPFHADELLARVKVHLHIKKSHDDLRRRNDELELIARARQDMADMIVHDLKAPLSSIKGTLDLIVMHGLISEQGYASLLENAGSAADFMLLMLNDLLDVGQAQETGLKPEIAPFEVPALFKKLSALFSGRCRQTKVELRFRAGADARLLASDQNLIYRLAANLIANAIKASPRGAVVEVEALLAGGRLRLSVSDSGKGVADAEKQTIFEKYVTVSRKTEELYSGTGLGLTFCRLAAQALKGRIWVEDRDGGGSRFILELPFSPIAAAAPVM
jgi:two-component system sensor histidine kinase/response regulator